MVKSVMPRQYIILQKCLKFLETPKILLGIPSASKYMSNHPALNVVSKISGGGGGVPPLRSRGSAGAPQGWPVSV